VNYTKLTIDLKDAYKATTDATEGTDDKGTANLDKVFLVLPRAREDKVLEAIKDAGLYCRGKRQWIGSGYMISVSNGQGDKNTKAVTVFTEFMTNRGYQAIAFRKMD